MIITRKSLNRRTFLRGSGVALALPLLDAMVPALTATVRTAANAPRRLGIVYVPNGMAMNQWTPASEGAGFELTPILRPLSAFRDRLTVVSGLSHQTAKALPGEGGGDHARAGASFLTGVHPKKTQGADMRAGISFDQIAAGELGKQTQLASLEIGLDSTELVGSCDTDYSCTYVNTISWLTPTTPLPMEISPRAVFERMFGNEPSPAARVARARRNRSILDSVIEDVRSLRYGLGPRDQTKLDEYLAAVRETERSIQKIEARNGTELPVLAGPSLDIPATVAEHARLMYELQALAFQADVTRVSTFMMGREVSPRSYMEIGITEMHHPLSHHQHDPARMQKIAQINTYHVSLFAEFLDKLRSTPDGDGSLLDHVMILYGAGLSDSNDHAHDNLPLALIGGGTTGGRHVTCKPGTPVTNLFLSMLDRLGISMDQFGDSTGQMQQLSL